MKPWYDKSNEKQIGVPITRLPSWNERVPTNSEILAWLEQVLIAYDSKAIRLEFAEKTLGDGVRAATPYLQCGGKYAHLLNPGDDILGDGIPVLVKHLEQQRDEARREGFEAARAARDGMRFDSFGAVFETFADYEDSLKELAR